MASIADLACDKSFGTQTVLDLFPLSIEEGEIEPNSVVQAVVRRPC